MRLMRQIASFGMVGICATLIHVVVASLLIELIGMNGFIANASGAVSAFCVSYLGNARLTFAAKRTMASGAMRYVVVTLASLVLTSAILALTQRAGLSTFFYAVIVVIVVPPTTFLLAKFWAFQPPSQAQRG